MTWTIEALRYNVALGQGHLYFDIFNGNNPLSS